MQVDKLLSKKGRQVYSVEPESTVYDAIAKMADLNIGAMLVMENEQLAGIVSERDYRNKVILKGRTSKTTPVKDIMTDEVICVNPDDTVNLCMQLMTDNKIRHLPVVEDGTVVGVISIGDLLKTVIENQKNEIDSLRNYIASGYPG